MRALKLVLLCIVAPALGQWFDSTGKHQRWKVLDLGSELAADIQRKLTQTVDIRREHGRFLSYEVGFVMGQIREKYKLMMELYRICYDRYNKLYNMATPKIRKYITVYYFRKQELIHLLAVDIDKLVEVLERINLNITPFPSLLEGHVLRSRLEQEEDSEEEKQKLLEEAVKSKYREEYLMKKLNSPGQTTTSKRFINKWPVQGTWSLETY